LRELNLLIYSIFVNGFFLII